MKTWFTTALGNLALATLAIGAALPSAAVAAPVLSDNFDSYGYQLDWAPPTTWIAPGPGTVDLIGNTTSGVGYDFLPGNGGYVDLDGSNGIPGSLRSLANFAPGSYTLSFDLAGNQRGDGDKTTQISLGSWSTSLDLASASPFTLYSYTLTTSGGNLLFQDLSGGNGNIGNLLDNVTLSAGVPEPTSWALMLVGCGLVGAAMRRRPALRLATLCA